MFLLNLFKVHCELKIDGPLLMLYNPLNIQTSQCSTLHWFYKPPMLYPSRGKPVQVGMGSSVCPRLGLSFNIVTRHNKLDWHYAKQGRHVTVKLYINNTVSKSLIA